MTVKVFAFVAMLSMPISSSSAESGLVLPDHPSITYTDHSGVTIDSSKARFLRAIASGDGNNYKHCPAGARVRFRTNAPSFVAKFFFNNLMTREDTYNDIITILVDGAIHSTLNPADLRDEFDYQPTINFGTSGWRTVEFVLPYAAGVDFTGLQLAEKSGMAPAVPRPSRRVVLLGDSITNGFWATSSAMAWPFLLGELLDAEVINLGFGSMTTVAANGTVAGGLGGDEIIVMLGYNDFAAQRSIVNFSAEYESMLENIRADAPSARIVVISPTWTNTSMAIPISSYRTEIANVVTAIADANMIHVDGTTLATGSTASFPDGVHPNNTGSSQIAAALAIVLGY